MNRSLLSAATVVALASAAAAQTPDAATLRGESVQTRKRLAEVEAKLDAADPGPVVEELQRILDEAGDDLIAVDGRQTRYVPARRLVHSFLARLKPAALTTYQARIDPPAQRLLAAAKRDRDPAPLWELLDRYAVAPAAVEGLLLLGDLEFERGEFRSAEQAWRQLPADDPAVRARVVLAVLFQDDPGRAAAELSAFRERHADAAGPLFGRTGKYLDTLDRFAASPPRPAVAAAREWPTVGGGSSRTGFAPGRLPNHLPDRPTWTAPLADPADVARGGPRPSAGFPVVLDGVVYIADGRRVVGFDLRTGLPARTCGNARVYARLTPPGPRAEGVIGCFGRLPTDPPGPARELWRLTPPQTPGRSPATWAGPPLVVGRRMWATLTRAEGGRLTHAVAHYDPADAPDRPAWLVEVADGPADPDARTRSEAVTLAGRLVVLTTNTGAVVALDARNGKPAWAYKYPRAVRRPEGVRGPDPAVAVYTDGRVVVAPADADRVFAFDAGSGQLLWESGTGDGFDLLGVADRRVIVTVAGPVAGVRALDLRSGSHRDAAGWVQHVGTGPPTAGRGLIGDDVLWWPTRAGLFPLDPADGRPLGRPAPVPGGNLAFADGVLVVVTAGEVRGYVTGRDGPGMMRE